MAKKRSNAALNKLSDADIDSLARGGKVSARRRTLAKGNKAFDKAQKADKVLSLAALRKLAKNSPTAGGRASAKAEIERRRRKDMVKAGDRKLNEEFARGFKKRKFVPLHEAP